MLFGLIHGVPSKREEVAFYVNHLGYAYCTVCKHLLNLQSVDRCTSAKADWSCDHCKKPLVDSIEIIEGTATIECVPCKIF